ncbi:hypothetical protein [Nocardioides pakistanensis]
MGATFLTSDEHYFHAAINDLAERPFETVDECAHEMIRRHNKRVREGDRTIHLGDFLFGDRGRLAEILGQLNGEHVLVWGNHDRGSGTKSNAWAHQREYLDAGFHGAVEYGTLALPQVKGGAPARKVLLSHFPYHADHLDGPRYNQFRLRDEGAWLIHGHVHGLYTVRDRGVNVGVDVWDFYPVQDHEVARLIHQVESGQRDEF